MVQINFFSHREHPIQNKGTVEGGNGYQVGSQWLVTIAYSQDAPLPSGHNYSHPSLYSFSQVPHSNGL
jgi:hypothetical protein